MGIEYIVVLFSEIFPEKLKLFNDIDAWVQVACPSLSMNWGSAFDKPLLTPYKASVALKVATLGDDYPMDFHQFYANTSLGLWTVCLALFAVVFHCSSQIMYKPIMTVVLKAGSS